MKHLILSGGRPWLGADGGQIWVDALLARVEDETRVAYCLFAQDESEWPETMATNKQLMQQCAGSRKISFDTLDHDRFAEVSAWANVIVIVGGDPAVLKKALEQHGDLMQLWDGKTISGASAGADIMCQKYLYLQDKTVGEGFGWVVANLIPHWEAADWEDWTPADWRWAEQHMAEAAGKTPLLTIREGDFVEYSIT